MPGARPVLGAGRRPAGTGSSPPTVPASRCSSRVSPRPSRTPAAVVRGPPRVPVAGVTDRRSATLVNLLLGTSPAGRRPRAASGRSDAPHGRRRAPGRGRPGQVEARSTGTRSPDARVPRPWRTARSVSGLVPQGRLVPMLFGVVDRHARLLGPAPRTVPRLGAGPLRAGDRAARGTVGRLRRTDRPHRVTGATCAGLGAPWRPRRPGEHWRWAPTWTSSASELLPLQGVGVHVVCSVSLSLSHPFPPPPSSTNFLTCWTC